MSDRYSRYRSKVERLLKENYGLEVIHMPQDHVLQAYQDGEQPIDFVERMADKLGLINIKTIFS